MTKAELMEYVGKKIYVYFKDGQSGIFGLLGYADDFSEKHNYRKPNYFYIGLTSFKVSHVRKIECEASKRPLDTETVYSMTNAEASKILTQRKCCMECVTDCTCNECDAAFDMAIKALKQDQKWIPVSERLPEDRREVLVTAYWHETYQVMMASYYGDGLWWCVPFNNCGEHMQRLNPKAWMPLPAPYKAESEDKE